MSSYPTSNLSQENILRDIHDAATQTIRTSATAVIAPGLEVSIDAADDNIAIRNTNNNNELLINPDGSINVDTTIVAPLAIKNVAGTNTLAVNTDGSINIEGAVTASPSGLSVAGRITKVALSSAAWTALPTTPLANRNGMTIQNRSGGIMYIEYNNSNPVGDGILVPNNGERFYDVKPSIVIYACLASGTGNVYVEEIS